MKKSFIQFAGLFALALCALATEAQAQSICLYEHSYYQGRSTCFNAYDQVPDLVPYGMNDQVSSVAVYGPVTASLCEHSYMGGRCLNINGNVPDLSMYGFNDTASSLRVGGFGGGYPPPGPGPGPHPGPHPGPGPGGGYGQACFYEHSYFNGRSLCLQRGERIYNLSQRGFNDMISSISLSGHLRVTVCEHDGMNGYCRSFYDNVSDLVPYSMNDMITSISVD